MTPEELRSALFEKGVKTSSEFEFVLTVLIDHMLKKVDPPLDHFFDEEKAFALGFCVGSASAFIILEDAWERIKN